ncbi:MAG TPA: DUF6580 family putative transport protein [Gammaproteobacteria bacterium]|nr:DUF6580 family putative transport protein [Gammaproteobacteria bacterium]
MTKINYATGFIFILLMIASRVIPHLPNLTPTIVLSLLLGNLFNKKSAVMFFVISQAISDILLSFLYHYPLWGSWSFFVYSGLILSIVFLRFNLSQALLATILFWVWTNLGVFLFSGLYLYDGEGFLRCYSLALPFLGYSFLGTLFYYSVLRFFALDSVPSNRVFSTAL